MNIEDFRKVELRVGRVREAERVEGSEKLLKLKVDLGPSASSGPPPSATENKNQFRQIIAGIGKAYAPEELVGKEIIVVANLEPRMLMGLESQGMLLAANGESGPIFLAPEKEVPPGASIQ